MHRIDHPHHPISQTTAHLSVFTIFFISTTCPSYIQLPSSIIPFSPAYRQSPKLSTVTVHAYVPSNGNSEEEIKEPLLPKKEEIPRMIPAEVGLAYCNKLFFLEKLFRDLTPEERKDRRLETEVPVWENFYAWLEQLNPVKRSKLEKAVIYAKNHKETLRNYLQDGSCEISNTAAEPLPV